MYSICAMLFSSPSMYSHRVRSGSCPTHCKIRQGGFTGSEPPCQVHDLKSVALERYGSNSWSGFQAHHTEYYPRQELIVGSISQYLTDEKSELFQVKSWCREAKAITWNNADQDSMLPYGVAMRPQWVQKQMSRNNPKTQWKASHKYVFWMYCKYIYN